jgi:Amt family ammonium transporter
MVAITPSCAFLDPWWALALGVVVGVVCGLAVELKWKLGFDDSLDVVGVHLVAGIIGTLWIGLFGRDCGLLLGFGAEQLGKQAIGVVVVGLYAFAVSWLVGMAIQKTVGFRITTTDEIAGVDNTVHGELAYQEADPRWSWGRSGRD